MLSIIILLLLLLMLLLLILSLLRLVLLLCSASSTINCYCYYYYCYEGRGIVHVFIIDIRSNANDVMMYIVIEVASKGDDLLLVVWKDGGIYICKQCNDVNGNRSI